MDEKFFKADMSSDIVPGKDLLEWCIKAAKELVLDEAVIGETPVVDCRTRLDAIALLANISRMI